MRAQTVSSGYHSIGSFCAIADVGRTMAVRASTDLHVCTVCSWPYSIPFYSRQTSITTEIQTPYGIYLKLWKD